MSQTIVLLLSMLVAWTSGLSLGFPFTCEILPSSLIYVFLVKQMYAYYNQPFEEFAWEVISLDIRFSLLHSETHLLFTVNLP